jgi:glucosamine 6-phosphate synthetase-like amidotransferase/phosphosugar isomerase protein
MCGIAGYSLSPDSPVERTLAAQALLAGIAERGADAVGYAYRGAEATVTVHKQRSGATALLESIHVPGQATQALVHVRDYTKGHPTIAANNHPVRHGRVVGIHNGIITNDDELFAHHRFEREEPEMTVDSEAIFALVDAFGARREALEQLRGAMATAWLDERQPELLFLSRGVGRPLWLGHGRHELFFASTRDALDVVEQTLRLRLRKREVPEGALAVFSGGKGVSQTRFRVDRSYVEEHPLPSVRAPHEGVSCLERLAVIAAVA